jgi:GDP-L-fucose synthase
MYHKIYVTGATGFVGKNLLPRLKAQYPESKILVGDEITCNLLDYDSVYKAFNIIRPDCVIHLAAVCGGIQANKNSPATFINDNLTMGLNVINVSKKIKCVKKFVMLGTVCAYPKFTSVPFKEEDIWNGYPEETNAPYGIAKKTLVELLIAYNKQYGFNCVNLFPTNMYGPHDHFNLTTSHVIPALILKVYRAITKGEDKIEVWGTGNASREFLYVEDCCHAICLALTTNPGPQPINIGTGKEITIGNLVYKICDIMNFDGMVTWDYSKPDGQPRRCLDITRAKKLLNYAPYTTLDSGLRKTINWFIKNDNVSNIQ